MHVCRQEGGDAVVVGAWGETPLELGLHVPLDGESAVAKHARARRAWVRARVEDGALSLEVRDDGVGGAQAGGSGLVGLADRLAVLDGRLWVEAPPAGGTLVAATIPVA